MARTKAVVLTTDQQIEVALKEHKAMDRHIKELMQRKKEEDRSARTKRLIERGAIMEKLIDKPESFTNEQIQSFLTQTIATKFAKSILLKLKEEAAEAAALVSAETQPQGDAATAANGGGAGREVG